MDTTRTLRNGAIGLAVMVVVGLVPMLNVLASVIGGGVAGYLQRDDPRGGAVAGAATGLLWTLLTLVLLLLVTIGAGLAVPPGVGPFDWVSAAGGGAFIAVLFLLTNALVVVTATVGGAIGGLLAGERGTAPEQPEQGHPEI